MTKSNPQSSPTPPPKPVQNTAMPLIKAHAPQPISKPDKNAAVPKYILLANERMSDE